MVKRKGLGKGLSALIPEKTVEIDGNVENVQNIDINNLKPNENNARKTFDEESLESLAESIKKYGVIQPLVVLNKGKYYEIVAGERRYKAAKMAKLKSVPVIVKQLDSKDKDMVSMIENIQREDLNAYEEAMAYKNLMNDYNMTQNELSDLIGKSRTYIANTVRLLSLDDRTISELEDKNITSTQARALLGVEDLTERYKYLDMLLNKKITVNQIEKKSKSLKKDGSTVEKDIYIKDLENRLMEAFDAKVRINKTNTSWKVSIEFFDDEQVEDFLNKYNIGD